MAMTIYNPPQMPIYNPPQMQIYNPPPIPYYNQPPVLRNNTRNNQQRRRVVSNNRGAVRNNMLSPDEEEEEEDDDDDEEGIDITNNNRLITSNISLSSCISLANNALSTAAKYYNRSISYVITLKTLLSDTTDSDDINIFYIPDGNHLILLQTIVNLDVQQFKHGELSATISRDNVLTVEGTHRQPEDAHGLIAVHFVKRYVLAKTCDVRKIECNLSSDGVLTIKVPRVVLTDGEFEIIPIKESETSATLSGEVELEEYYDAVEDINDNFCAPESMLLKSVQTICIVDVHLYKHEELTVKLTKDNVLSVEGTHHEPKGAFGLISRQFVKRYTLPKTCDVSTIECSLSSDGVLTIRVSRVVLTDGEKNSIPIKLTGKPANLPQSEVEKVYY